MIKKILLSVCLMMCLACPAWAQSYSVYSEQSLEAVQIDSQEILIPLQPSATSDDGGGAAVLSDEAQTIAVNSIYTVYDSGLPSSTYLDWAQNLVKRVPIGKDYVFARTGQYQYIFAYGDFSDGFSGSATVWQLNLPVSYSSDSYSMISFVDNAFSFSPGQGIVYSSLSDYPSLTTDYTREILFTLLLFGCCYTAIYILSTAFKTLNGF